MIPKTISASSLQTADSCLARYKAENLDFTPTAADKVAANIGTAVHGALEMYVEAVYMKKDYEPDFQLLMTFYRMSYLKTFDTVETKTPEFKDGEAMLKTWFARTDLSGVMVMSVEKKTRMPVPSSIGPVLMTYIWDRCDFFEENGKRIIRVVDYKTIRANLSPDDLRKMLQPRIYDLAARAQFKDENIDEFQIVLDLLRHEPVGVIFSREDAEDMWAGIKARLERIIATPDENPPETLNKDCPYCVRKLQCKTLQRNIAGGGTFSIMPIEDVMRKRYELASQQAGIASALEELDKRLTTHAQHENVLFFADDDYKVSISARRTRTIDSVEAARILGPEMMGTIGKVRLGDVDELIKAGKVTDAQIVELKRAMGYTLSDPSVKVVPKTK